MHLKLSNHTTLLKSVEACLHIFIQNCQSMGFRALHHFTAQKYVKACVHLIKDYLGLVLYYTFLAFKRDAIKE